MEDPQVKEIYTLHGTASVSANENTFMEGIISIFVKQPVIRGVFLVNDNQIYSGMVTRIDLIKWVHLQVSGGKGMDNVPIWNLLKLVAVRRVKDLTMNSQMDLSVRETDTIQNALDKMLNSEEDILPVLDNEGKVLGDLRLSEILWWILESGKLKG